MSSSAVIPQFIPCEYLYPHVTWNNSLSSVSNLIDSTKSTWIAILIAFQLHWYHPDLSSTSAYFTRSSLYPNIPRTLCPRANSPTSSFFPVVLCHLIHTKFLPIRCEALTVCSLMTYYHEVLADSMYNTLALIGKKTEDWPKSVVEMSQPHRN